MNPRSHIAPQAFHFSFKATAVNWNIETYQEKQVSEGNMKDISP